MALGLSAIAIFKLNRSTALFLLVGAVALWASLGPAWGLYRWMHALVPGFSGVRVPPRISIYVLFALAILAAQGAAVLFRRFPVKILAPIFIVFPLVEGVRRPDPVRESTGSFRRSTGGLRRKRARYPSSMMPLPPVKRQRDNAVYLYWSTVHYKPLANGYATVVPPVYAEIAESMKTFPDADGVALLRRLGFRYVILHRDRYLRARAARMEEGLTAEPGLNRIYRTENETVFELVR